MKFKIFSLFFIAFFAISCVDFDDVKFHDIQNVETKGHGISNMVVEGTLLMSNSSSANIKVKDVECAILFKGKEVVSVASLEKFSIKKRSEKSPVDVALRVKVEGSMLELMALSFQLQHLSVNVKIRARAGLLFKKIEYDDLTISQLCNILGIEPKDLMKSVVGMK